MAVRNLLAIILVCLFSQYNALAQSNYTLVNDATQIAGCHCYQLTPDQGDQGGGVYQNNSINLNNSFDYTFSVFLGSNSSGADGMCFILTNNITQIGAQGGGLGYSGLAGNSLAVEYDTYQNGWDPNNHHMALEYAGQVEHPTGTLVGPVDAINGGLPMDDGNWHTTEVVWNAAAQTYMVYFDGSLRLSYSGNIVANFFANNPVVNWGWSGSTGGDENTQQVCFNSTANFSAGTNYQTCNPTVQFNDISTSDVASIQSWAWNFGDPSSGGSNTSALQNPTHTFSSTGTFTVREIITDISGCLDTAVHAVVVAPNISLTPALTDPSCNGATNGSITVTASGGFGASAGLGGYHYTWSNGLTGFTGANSDLGLTSGNYDITVNDGVCSVTASYNLTQPSAITATTSSTDANCGSDNGSVTITISGGTPPYQNVVWDGVTATASGNSYTRTGLGAGTYVANFTDANGCSALLEYTATVGTLPCGYTESTSSTNVTCFGGSNGTVTLTVTGTVGTAAITWTNSSGTVVGTGPTVTGLPAGTYTYNYVDQEPTTFTGTVVVHQPGGALTVTLATVNTTCSYLNNGSAVASVTANGTPTYNYAWSVSGEPNGPTATGLSPGGITVTVTDANGCSGTATGTVSGQTPLALTINAQPDSCYQTNTGKISVGVTGGTPNYTYLWSSGPTAIGDTVYSLAANPYTVTVTDFNGCTATAAGTVSQPPPLTATLSDSNIACFGGANGTITVVPSGGNGGFTYSWNGSSSTNGTASGLAPGTYYVTITDSKLCKVIDSATITQPASAFTVTEDSVNVACFGLPTGSITLTLAGGSTPYGTVTWAGGATGASRTGLSAGTYSYTATDAHDCSVTGSVNITQPASSFAVAVVDTNVLCFGGNTGAVALTPSGGTQPYATAEWLDGFVGDVRNNLAAGSYYWADSDAHGCIDTGSVVIGQPASAFTVAVTKTNVSCYGGSTGSITLTLSGGTTAYQTVTWRDGGATGTSRTSLPAGNYSYIATDANGCTDSATVTITQPASAFTVTEDSVNVACLGLPTGSITLTLSGGTAPYQTVTWAGGATGTSRTGLSAGNYSYTATDANGCSVTGSVNITQPASAFAVAVLDTNVLCFGGNTGAVALTPSGGTQPYATAEWLDGFVGDVRNNLAAGTYYWADSDAHGCIDTGSVVIGQPASAFTVAVTKTNVSCYGGSTGSITLTLSGGTTAYQTVTWRDGGATGTSRTSLPAGNYSYIATDANGCTDSATVTITQPASAFTVTEDSVNVACFGLPTGSITLTLSGGTAPYQTVTWAGGATGTGRTGLSAGNYSYTATDANGCSVTGSVNITQPASAFAVGVTQVNVLCYGGSTGSITLTPSGGTQPYATAEWLDGFIGDIRSNLAAGTYSYGDSDNNGCLVTGSVNITQPAAAFTVTAAITNVLCNGGNDGAIVLTLSGGTTAYQTVTWRDGGATGTSRSNLTAGNYSYIATDANGCTDSATVTVTQPNAITATAIFDSINCFGSNNGTAIINATGGDNNFTYELDNSGVFQSSNIFSNLAPGSHTVTIQDGNSCTGSVTFVTYQPTQLTLSLVSTTNDLCFGNCDGLIVVSASGGTPPYLYSIDAVNYYAPDSFAALCANPSYTVGVKDNNGCENNIQAAITQPTPVVVSPVDSISPTCNNGNNGSVTVMASGGSGTGYTYSINGGAFQASGTFTGLTPGSYTVTAQDANACVGTYTITVINPVATSSFTTTPSNVLCFGGSTGYIFVTVTGSTTPYSYLWSQGGATTDTLSNIPAGTYKVTVTDGNGCVVYGADSSTTVTQPTQISASDVMTPASCYGGSNGTITVTAVGGTGPYINGWSGTAVASDPSASATGLSAGAYVDTITDANGCQFIDTPINVTQPGPIIIGDSVTLVSCAGDSNGAITLTVSGGTPGYTYLWSQSGTSNPLTGIPTGSYAVTVTDSHQCTATDTMSVGVVNPMAFNASKSNVLCPPLSNGSIVLAVTGGTPAYQYSWSDGSTSAGLYGLPVGIDSVTVTDSRGCMIDTGFVIINDSAFSITTDPDTATINEGNSFTLAFDPSNHGAGTVSTISWTPGVGLSCTDCQSAEAAPVVTTQYDVMVETDSGCIAYSSALITVVPQHQIYIPNGFTPNGDGINDYWEAFGNKKAWVLCEVSVYDRWGEKVFESNDIDFQWDGKYRGTYVMPGEYVYTFKVVFVDDYTISNKGSITVIR